MLESYTNCGEKEKGEKYGKNQISPLVWITHQRQDKKELWMESGEMNVISEPHRALPLFSITQPGMD